MQIAFPFPYVDIRDFVPGWAKVSYFADEDKAEDLEKERNGDNVGSDLVAQLTRALQLQNSKQGAQVCLSCLAQWRLAVQCHTSRTGKEETP